MATKPIPLGKLEDNLNHAAANNSQAIEDLARAQRAMQSALDRLQVNAKRFGWASNSITPQRRKGSV